MSDVQATILVVDDDPSLRSVITLVLQNAGYRVFTAEDGTSAFARLAEEKIDLVLSDIVMPQTDGIELVREIRAKYPRMRVISMSGGGAYLTAALCLKLADRLGATGILSKPFTPAQLIEAIQAALRADPAAPHDHAGPAS